MKRILLLLAVSFLTFSVNAQQKDWAKFGRFVEANKAVTESPDAVFMGNSITEQWASFDPEFFSQNNFVGRGISGQTTSEMLVRMRQDVIGLKPKAVVIMAGINDIAMNNGYIALENIFGNIVSMCELAKANDIKVILCSVTPCAQFRWRKELEPAQPIRDLNQMIKEYAAANKIAYVDYHSALTTPEGGMPEKWSKDGCHVNLECYRSVMEPLVCDAVNKVLKIKKNPRQPMR
ncbi:MAG: acylhydrolase [Alistipes sp.]|nr:acylhydrolase [Alistipes sp.]